MLKLTFRPFLQIFTDNVTPVLAFEFGQRNDGVAIAGERLLRLELLQVGNGSRVEDILT